MIIHKDIKQKLWSLLIYTSLETTVLQLQLNIAAACLKLPAGKKYLSWADDNKK